jgi:hypothetical protein
MNCFALVAYNDVLTRQQELVARARDERDELEQQYATLEAEVAARPTITADPIPRPSNVKGLKITELREMMGLAGETHKEDWNRVRVVPLTSVLDCCSSRVFQDQVRRVMEAGQIDWDLTFKAQRQQKLCTLYAGVSLGGSSASSSCAMMFTICPD